MNVCIVSAWCRAEVRVATKGVAPEGRVALVAAVDGYGSEVELSPKCARRVAAFLDDSGQSTGLFDDVRVFRSEGGSALVTVAGFGVRVPYEGVQRLSGSIREAADICEGVSG